MFHELLALPWLWTVSVLVGVSSLVWFGIWLRKELKRRADRALLAAVVDHYIHDRVRNEYKYFERDRTYVIYHHSSITYSFFALIYPPILTLWARGVGEGTRFFRSPPLAFLVHVTLVITHIFMFFTTYMVY